MYINIAICDDQIDICHQLEQYIIENLSTKGFDFNVEIYTSGNNLCQSMKTECFDLIFLDIELPDINGIQTGSYIRNVLYNDTVQIVYISAVQSYAMELFQSRPLNFLIKPLTKEAVKKVISTFLRLNIETESFFTFKIGGAFHKIPLSEIIYFESHKRKVTVVTSKNSYEFYDSLKNIQKQLSSHCFLLVHQSILANFNKISFFEYDRITMTNNTILPISQSKRSEVKKVYLEFVKGVLYD